MIKNGDVFDFLCEKYPLNTACDFDNVGFLVGDKQKKVERALVCLDCDLSALNKAVSIGASLIVTHHPVIFGGLDSVLSGSVVYGLVENGISVISMHTNLDIADGGVTDTLCDFLGLSDKKPFAAHDGFLIRKITFDSEINPDDFAKHAGLKFGFSVRYSAGRPIKTALVCSGAGGDYITDAIAGGFDALITADIKHHQFVTAKNNDLSLFDLGHYASENIIVNPLADMLSARFGATEFIPYSPDYIKCV